MKCEYGCGNDAKFQMTNGKWCCCNHWNKCSAIRKRNSDSVKQAHKDGKMPYAHLPDARLNAVESRRNNLELIYKEMTWEELPFPEKFRIVLEDQNNKCLICGISEWNKKPLKLHFDHIDGNNKNNLRDNVRYICPNCHSQTDTYTGKNIKNKNRKGIIFGTKVSDADLISALKTEPNIRQALIKVGLVPKGANYTRCKKLNASVA